MDEYKKDIMEIKELLKKIQKYIAQMESKLGIDNNDDSKQELDEAYSDGYREGYETAKYSSNYSPEYYNNVYSKFIEDCNNNVNSTQAFNPYK